MHKGAKQSLFFINGGNFKQMQILVEENMADRFTCKAGLIASFCQCL